MCRNARFVSTERRLSRKQMGGGVGGREIYRYTRPFCPAHDKTGQRAVPNHQLILTAATTDSYPTPPLPG